MEAAPQFVERPCQRSNRSLGAQGLVSQILKRGAATFWRRDRFLDQEIESFSRVKLPKIVVNEQLQ